MINIKELCGEPAKGGPCTMPKDHYANYHRHREYEKVAWIISTRDGKELESGTARVPMNYAISRCFTEHNDLVITLKRHNELPQSTQSEAA